MQSIRCKDMCGGSVSVKTGKFTHISNRVSRPLMACDVCGRVHFEMGTPLFINKKSIYFINGEMTEKN